MVIVSVVVASAVTVSVVVGVGGGSSSCLNSRAGRVIGGSGSRGWW